MVLAESTRKLLGTLFEFEDLGTQDLKGISGSVGAWAALRPASVDASMINDNPENRSMKYWLAGECPGKVAAGFPKKDMRQNKKTRAHPNSLN